MRDSFEERTARVMRRMLPGSFAGRSEQISRVQPSFGQLSTEVPVAAAIPLIIFDFPGPLIIATSDIFRTNSDDDVVGAYAQLTKVGDTDTVFAVLQNGLSVGTVTVIAGRQTGSGLFAATFVPTDFMQGAIITAGSGGAGGVLQVIGS